MEIKTDKLKLESFTENGETYKLNTPITIIATRGGKLKIVKAVNIYDGDNLIGSSEYDIQEDKTLKSDLSNI